MLQGTWEPDGVSSVVPGTSTTYTITLSNDGPTDVPAGAVVSDAIPTNTAGSESEADCAIALGVFTCTTSAVLASGASVSYQLTLAIDADYPGATVVNTASVSSSTIPDPFPANDSATDTDTIAGSADLTVTKTVDNASPQEGDTVTYIVSVTNDGPDDATGVRVIDALPAGLSFVSASVTHGSYDPATGVWIVGSLTVGETARLRIRARVDNGTAGTTITNQANVSAADQADPASEDDADSAPIAVEATGGGGGGGTGAGGGTAFTGFPGAARAIAWMLGLAMLGLAAIGLGSRRRTGAMRSIEPGGSDGAPPAGRFLAEPFFFCKE